MSSQRMQPTKYFWQGERVRLRAVEPEDAEQFFRWNQNSETTRMLDYVWPPGSLAAVRAWAQKVATQEVKEDAIFCIIENLEGNVVGAINPHTTNRRVGSFAYGLSIGEEHRGRGYASEAILLLLRYFFEELRYQKVTVTVYECNLASIALHEKLGFQREGRLRRTVYTQGRYFDEFFYGMTCEEFADRYGDLAARS